MTRRELFSGAVALTLTATPGKSAAPVRVGFLGVSHSHADKKLRIALASPDYDLVAAAEPDASLRMKYEALGVKFVSPEALLRDPAIEAVFVESAVREHARQGLQVVQAGKHLHLEKPPALDVESFRAIQNAARERKLILQLGYMWRHHPGFLRIFEAVRKQWLGAVYMVRAEMNKTLGAADRIEWAEFRGGHMFELAPHVIDPLIRLLGRPEKVTPFLRKFGNFDDNMADTVVAVFEFPQAMGIVVGTSLQPGSGRYREFVVYGTKGTMSIGSLDNPTLEVDFAEAVGPYPQGPHLVALPEYTRYVDDMKEFAAAIRGESEIAVTEREDLMVQEAIIAASGM